MDNIVDFLFSKEILRSTSGVMAQWYIAPIYDLRTSKEILGSNPLVCKWKPCWPSATELDLSVTTAWSSLLLCFKKKKKKNRTEKPTFGGGTNLSFAWTITSSQILTWTLKDQWQFNKLKGLLAPPKKGNLKTRNVI